MQNLGHCRAKQTFFRSVVSKMDEKQAVTFALFSTFLNPQRATLTYSAMGLSGGQTHVLQLEKVQKV